MSPDVALAASAEHDGYLICNDGTSSAKGFTAVGGTSAAAPGLASIVALLVQKTGGPQGNINPRLYSLAATRASVFHEITSGDNMVACQAGSPNCSSSGEMGYKAGTGYSQTVGLGSVDAYNLVNSWRDFGLSINPASMASAAIPPKRCLHHRAEWFHWQHHFCLFGG